MTPKSPDSSHDQREEMLQHSEISPNSVEEFPINEFEKIQGRIEKVLREIDVALGQTSILALKVWIIHPEINSELQDLKKQIDENKQNMSREFSCDVLWKIKNLIDKYWDDRERNIINWLTECLIRLPQLHTEIRDIKGTTDIIEGFEKELWNNIQKLTYLLPKKSSGDGADTPNPTKPNRWSSIKPSYMA